MKGPAPFILALTLIAALAAGMSMRSEDGLVDVYSRSAASSGAWRLEMVPADRVLALVLDQEGLERLAMERIELRPALDRVDVDFETHVLLVAYMGAMPTGGYSIAVTRVQAFPGSPDRPASLAVKLAVSSPAPDSVVTQAFTYPADVVSIRRDAWPPGLLEALARGEVPVEVSDQDERDWGPAIVYAGAPGS